MQQFKLILLATIGIAIFAGCNTQSANNEDSTENAGKAVPVHVDMLDMQTMPVSLSKSGTFDPWEKVYITGQAGVRINKIYVKEDDHVKEGQILARMNTAQLEQAREQLQLARKNLKRLDTLVNIGSVSQQRFDQAQTEYENAKSQFNRLQENTILKAPFNGVVTAKHFYNGETFSPGANSPSIVTVMQLQPLKLTVNISENYYSQIQKGMKAKVTVDAVPDTQFLGTVHKKFPIIDEQTRTFTTEIRLPNKQDLLRPGMSATAEFHLRNNTSIYVPISAITKQEGTERHYAYTLSDDNWALRKRVILGEQSGHLVAVDSGVKPQETLITDGIARLSDSTKVKPLERPKNLQTKQ